MNLQKAKSFCGEDDNKCKKNSTFVAEVLSYTQKIRTFVKHFWCIFYLFSRHFRLFPSTYSSYDFSVSFIDSRCIDRSQIRLCGSNRMMSHTFTDKGDGIVHVLGDACP